MLNKINEYFALRTEIKASVFRTVSLSDRLYAVVFFDDLTDSIRIRVLTRGTSTQVHQLEDLESDELIAYANMRKAVDEWALSGGDFPIQNDSSAAGAYQNSVNVMESEEQEKDNG